jgi:DNA-binding MarR family transcriptional regulator
MVSGTIDIAIEVASDLRPVVLRLARELRRETAEFGITSRQATLLWLVKSRPGASLRALAEQEGISSPALSTHVDRLVQSGLIERVRSEDDRRRVGLELTAEGARVLRSVRERRTAWLASRLSTLRQRELATVQSALPALLKIATVERESR